MDAFGEGIRVANSSDWGEGELYEETTYTWDGDRVSVIIEDDVGWSLYESVYTYDDDGRVESILSTDTDVEDDEVYESDATVEWDCP